MGDNSESSPSSQDVAKAAEAGTADVSKDAPAIIKKEERDDAEFNASEQVSDCAVHVMYLKRTDCTMLKKNVKSEKTILITFFFVPKNCGLKGFFKK